MQENENGMQIVAELVFKDGCNCYDDGCSRTIKNQYYKNSISNFESHGTFGASGVIEIWKIENRGRLYLTDGISPAINCMQGGGLQPHIVEVKKMEQIICAMRGRDKENPNHRGPANENYEQVLEVNNSGISNTLTSVTKDNLVLETTDVSALRMVRTEEGKKMRKDYESGKIHHGFNEYREAEPREDGCSNTLSTVQKDNHILETKKIKIRQATKDGFIDCEIPGVADLNYADSKTRRGRVVEGGQISPTLTTENIPSVIELGDPDFYNFLYEIDGEIYLIRIRKLIPKECLALMNVDQEYIERMLEVESNTNLYKAAGNSIVVNCLTAIFGMMFEGKEDVYKSYC